MLATGGVAADAVTAPVVLRRHLSRDDVTAMDFAMDAATTLSCSDDIDECCGGCCFGGSGYSDDAATAPSCCEPVAKPLEVAVTAECL